MARKPVVVNHEDMNALEFRHPVSSVHRFSPQPLAGNIDTAYVNGRTASAREKRLSGAETGASYDSGSSGSESGGEVIASEKPWCF